MTGRSHPAAAPAPGDGRPAALPPLLPGLTYLAAALTRTALPPAGETAWIEEEAQALLAAERFAAPIAPLATRRPGLTLADAYRIQWAGARLRIEAGARPVGHKIGLTSAAMREQMGIAEPDSGILLDDMVVPDGGTVTLADLVSPRIEAEFAFRLGRDLAGTAVDLETARRSVDQVQVTLEVIDTRYRDWQITLADSIADNAACARIVTGPPVELRPGTDLREQLLSVTVDDEPAASGRGREVLGDPLEAVAWLARRLAAFGTGLKAGDVVLAGSVHASLPLRPGTEIRAACEGLPPVTAHIV
ncbi:2-keto-4-pentenoate hydratase [Kitasatospora sp. NPDC101801]|uniref:2-keto-4-pentenoate hydratase n=1 Tax=Kitasatospora sp. NPDC101801 TaxID=3364103 RepID=UPI00380C0B7D